MGLTMTLKTNSEDFEKYAEKYGEDFQKQAMQAHDMWVMRCLEYMAKFHRVATGRSRAAWFNFMDVRGYDYQRSLPPTGQEDRTDEGKSQGTSVSEPFRTTIINNVDYVEPMNRRFGLFGFANTTSGKMALGSQGIRLEEKIALFEAYGQDNFNRFMAQAKTAFEAGGKTFKPGPLPSIDNPPPMA